MTVGSCSIIVCKTLDPVCTLDCVRSSCNEGWELLATLWPPPGGEYRAKDNPAKVDRARRITVWWKRTPPLRGTSTTAAPQRTHPEKVRASPGPKAYGDHQQSTLSRSEGRHHSRDVFNGDRFGRTRASSQRPPSLPMLSLVSILQPTSISRRPSVSASGRQGLGKAHLRSENYPALQCPFPLSGAPELTAPTSRMMSSCVRARAQRAWRAWRGLRHLVAGVHTNGCPRKIERREACSQRLSSVAADGKLRVSGAAASGVSWEEEKDQVDPSIVSPPQCRSRWLRGAAPSLHSPRKRGMGPGPAHPLHLSLEPAAQAGILKRPRQDQTSRGPALDAGGLTLSDHSQGLRERTGSAHQRPPPLPLPAGLAWPFVTGQNDRWGWGQADK